MIQPPFQELYAGKSCAELLARAADGASLRDGAKAILAQELQRGNLQQPRRTDIRPRARLKTVEL